MVRAKKTSPLSENSLTPMQSSGESYDECKHRDSVDDEEGHVLCANCGKILSYAHMSAPEYSGGYVSVQSIKKKMDPFGDYNLEPHIKERSTEIYNTVADGKTYRCKNRLGLLAACIYKAYKESNVLRSPNDILALFPAIKMSDFSNGISMIEMKLKTTDIYDIKYYLNKYIDALLNKFIGVYNCLSRSEIGYYIDKISGRDEINTLKPQCIVASIIYCILERKLKVKPQRRKFAELVEITEPTLSATIKTIKAIPELFPLEVQ